MLAYSAIVGLRLSTAGSARAHWALSPSSNANLNPRSSHSNLPSFIGKMNAVTVVHRHAGRPSTVLIFHREVASPLFQFKFTLVSGMNVSFFFCLFSSLFFLNLSAFLSFTYELAHIISYLCSVLQLNSAGHLVIPII